MLTARSLKHKYLCPPIVGYDEVVEEVLANPGGKDKPRIGISHDDGRISWQWKDEKEAAKILYRL